MQCSVLRYQGVSSAAEENGRERQREKGEEKSLNFCVLFFLPPVKDEKRHAVKDAFDFSASFFFPSHCLFFPLFSRDAGRNCILIMFG